MNGPGRTPRPRPRPRPRPKRSSGAADGADASPSAVFPRPAEPPARAPSPAPPLAAPAARPAPASSRRAAPVSAGADWSAVEALAVLAVVAAGFMVKDALLNADWLRAAPSASVVLVRVLVLAVFYAVQVAVLSFLAARRGASFASAFGLRASRTSVASAIGSAGLVVALLVATRSASTLYAAAADAAGFDPPVLRWNGDLSRVFGAGTPGLVLTVAMVVLIGPAVEELVFRGVLLRPMSARLGAWPAIVVSAALFAAYHFTAWLLIPSFVLGIALGWLASRRPTLWPAIALHSLYNAVAVALAFYLAAR